MRQLSKILVVAILAVSLIGAAGIAAGEPTEPIADDSVNVTNDTTEIFADVYLNDSAEESATVEVSLLDETDGELDVETLEVEPGEWESVEWDVNVSEGDGTAEINTTDGTTESVDVGDELTVDVLGDETADEWIDADDVEIGTIEDSGLLGGVLPAEIAGLSTPLVLGIVVVLFVLFRASDN